MITLYKYLEGHNKEDRDQLLSLVACELNKKLCHVLCWRRETR